MVTEILRGLYNQDEKLQQREADKLLDAALRQADLQFTRR